MQRGALPQLLLQVCNRGLQPVILCPALGEVTLLLTAASKASRLHGSSCVLLLACCWLQALSCAELVCVCVVPQSCGNTAQLLLPYQLVVTPVFEISRLTQVIT